MLALASLAQQEGGAALDDVDAVVDEGADGLVESHDDGLAVEHGQEDHGEALLHRCVLVELVQDDFRLRAALELDDDAHAIAIALVAHVADVVDDLLVHQFGNALNESGLVDLVGDFGDDQRQLVLGDVFGGHLGAHHKASAAGVVGLRDAGAAIEETAGGEIGPLHVLEDFREAGLGVLDQLDGGVDDLSEIVRRDVGGHADGDAVGAVHDESRNARGQHGGLEDGLVEVGHHIDGFHVDIGHHFFGDALHAALGVSVGRGRVAIDGSEVTLTIDQGITQRPWLGHAHQGVVDRRIAVGVVLLQALAHHTGAFGVALVVLQTFAVHGGENAAMHRLQSVTCIGQRTADDDRHGVSQIRPAHFLFDIHGEEVGTAARRSAAVKWELGILVVCHKRFLARSKAAKTGPEMRGRPGSG